MDDLTDKFFREDLTEAEEQSLSDRLRESDEAALRFGENAEKAYLRTGLPEPALPRVARHWFAPLGSALKTLAPFAFSILLALGGVWWVGSSPGLRQMFRERMAPPGGWRDAPVATEPPLEPGVRAGGGKKTSHAVPDADPSVSAGAREAGNAVDPRVQPIEGVGSSSGIKPQPVMSAPSKLPPPPPLEPVPALDVRGAGGNSLRLIIQRQTGGALLLRVLDDRGREVRRLYDGPLGAGRWAFLWDGQSSVGKAVRPGKYRVEVVSDGAVHQKQILIR